MNKLRIALAATLHKKVNKDSNGGTEVFVYLLGHELAKRGHQVTIFATGDSQVNFKLYPISTEININRLEQNQKLFYGYQLLESQLIAQKQNEFDIIHVNYYEPFLFAPFSKFISKPVVYTVHSDLFVSVEWIKVIQNTVKSTDIFVFVSKNAADNASSLKNKTYIYNGIDISTFPFSETHDNYLLWLGRIRRKKGILEAAEVAIQSKETVVISGVMDNSEEELFYNQKVKPLIEIHSNIKFIGPADFEKKINLYQRAKAFLFPISWEEPFGLTMIEAMACGTPVIAFNRGAVSEIIEDNKTGFITNNVDEMVEKIKQIDQIDRHQCRRLVEEKFNISKMTDNYEKLYYSLI